MVLYGSTVRECVRSPLVLLAGLGLLAGCASAPVSGLLGEGTDHEPTIVSVDSTRPPMAATVRLQQSSYVALVLVAPGHSATLLYPDSTTDNHLQAGSHRLRFSIPDLLLRVDTVRREPGDPTVWGRTRSGMSAIPRDAITYLLLLTSPQPLTYPAIFKVTAGVSIPIVEMEALNAVAKAVKSTLPEEPRRWAGHFVQVGLYPVQ